MELNPGGIGHDQTDWKSIIAAGSADSRHSQATGKDRYGDLVIHSRRSYADRARVHHLYHHPAFLGLHDGPDHDGGLFNPDHCRDRRDRNIIGNGKQQFRRLHEIMSRLFFLKIICMSHICAIIKKY